MCSPCSWTHVMCQKYEWFRIVNGMWMCDRILSRFQITMNAPLHSNSNGTSPNPNLWRLCWVLPCWHNRSQNLPILTMRFDNEIHSELNGQFLVCALARRPNNLITRSHVKRSKIFKQWPMSRVHATRNNTKHKKKKPEKKPSKCKCHGVETNERIQQLLTIWRSNLFHVL